MIDKAKVEKEAKEILDKFARSLEKVKFDNLNFCVNREEFERVEEKGENCEGFKKSLLENASKKNEDFVIAEKGDWKK
jgi:hypothetical protein